MTEETTEVLYRIGAGDLVVGVSGFTVRPPEARKKLVTLLRQEKMTIERSAAITALQVLA